MRNFSESVDRILNKAKEIAKDLMAEYVLTEHLLLALMTDLNNTAGSLLNQLITIDDVKSILTVESHNETNPQLSFRVLKVLENANHCAEQTGIEYIGSEHVLIGLLQENCRATHFLNEQGINLNELMRDVYLTFGFKLNDRHQLIAYKGKSISHELNTLQSIAKNLNECVEQGEIDNIVGREKELQRVIQILGRKNKNNPVLIGDAGVGKTAIADGLAYKIVTNQVPEYLKNKTVYSLDVGSLVAGTKYRGEFESRIKSILEEVRINQNVILFIDEIHMLIGAGGSEGTIDAANLLKPALARGDVQIIGATTYSEYRKFIEKDAALERRFFSVSVEEPTVLETINMIKGVVENYQDFHQLIIDDDAIVSAVELSNRYITDRKLPDKAFDVLDEAATIVKNKRVKIKKQKSLLETLVEGKYKQSKKLLSVVEPKSELNEHVTHTQVAQVVSTWSGVPVTELKLSDKKRLLQLEKILHERVIGQNEAIEIVSHAIRRSKSGVSQTNRPIGSFMFLGPTGVGKTELAKVLALTLFGSEDKIIRVDMSEYMERHNVSRLVGAPPGYVGFEDGGQLTEQVRKNPYAIVLFDEIEKAHPETFNILLQVLDDGFITDSKGRKIDFRNTILIMTSNIGATDIQDIKTVGFGAGNVNNQLNNEKIIREALKKSMKPEFLNRIDEIIIFNSLSTSDIENIVKIMVKQNFRHLSKDDITIQFSSKAIEKLAKMGYDKQYGARPLRRVLQKEIENRLSIAFLTGDIKKHTIVKVGVKNDKFNIQIKNKD